jgi:hypothetical protein
MSAKFNSSRNTKLVKTNRFSPALERFEAASYLYSGCRHVALTEMLIWLIASSAASRRIFTNWERPYVQHVSRNASDFIPFGRPLVRTCNWPKPYIVKRWKSSNVARWRSRR